MNVITAAIRAGAPALRLLDVLRPLYALGLRLYLADVFFKSGLTKIQSWDSTVTLFTYEYKVPLLSPDLAAVLATAIELGFPVLLAFGLAGRVAAAALFAFNIMAVISYPDLSEVGRMQHELWGLLLLVPLMYGPGRLSVDCLIMRRFKP